MGSVSSAPQPIDSARSLLSIGSAGSILSIGSVGSILSIGSAGSILSIGSAGSILSIGSAGSVMSVLSTISVGTILSARSQWAIASGPRGAASSQADGDGQSRINPGRSRYGLHGRLGLGLGRAGRRRASGDSQPSGPRLSLVK